MKTSWQHIIKEEHANKPAVGREVAPLQCLSHEPSPWAPSPAHSYNPSTWEVKARKSVVQGHSGLPSEFQANLGYPRLCSNKQTS